MRSVYPRVLAGVARRTTWRAGRHPEATCCRPGGPCSAHPVVCRIVKRVVVTSSRPLCSWRITSSVRAIPRRSALVTVVGGRRLTGHEVRRLSCGGRSIGGAPDDGHHRYRAAAPQRALDARTAENRSRISMMLIAVAGVMTVGATAWDVAQRLSPQDLMMVARATGSAPGLRRVHPVLPTAPR